MEGSIVSIFPLLLVMFLGLPAIIPNFTGRLHLGLEKLVQFWGFLNEGYRKGVSLLDFILFHPVVQLPIRIVGAAVQQPTWFRIWSKQETIWKKFSTFQYKI